ncbi:MAG: hypothetical protein HY880_08325, partial [Deltaproteobacteria bacterium]|nr:hypothetical protein [Deltaproteobacteria bacterium]
DTVCRKLPTLRSLVRPLEEIEEAAKKGAELLKDALGPGYEISIEDDFSQVGSGSLPEARLKTKVIAITHAEIKSEAIFTRFLKNNPPVLGRIRDDKFVLDMRTIDEPRNIVPRVR